MASIFDRFLQFLRPPAPANDARYDPVAALRDHVARDVAAGFYDPAQILQNAEDAFSEELEPAIIRAEAEAALKQASATLAAEQSRWPDVTDCDRLDAAFAGLEAEGIIARQNFSCCGSCGSYEIWDEAQAEEARGKTVQGYAFFHMQDTESAVEGDGLYLNYGAAEEGDEAAVAIGHRIVRQLERNGLRTAWNGELNLRIGVALDWKKRR